VWVWVKRLEYLELVTEMSALIYSHGRTLSFVYGDERIQFCRVDRAKMINRVQIRVHPDCRVVVAAPVDTDDQSVLLAVKKRARWIYEQMRGFRKQNEHCIARKYISGESHLYLGKQYVLKVIEAPNQKQRVKLLSGKLEVSIHGRQVGTVRSLLDSWYKDKAREVFSRRLDAMLDHTLWVSERPQFRTRVMQTRWGSCSPNGCLTLNPYLVKAPRECIDYVILHELCHIAEHNHSERFYRLMNQVMPNWEATKERLDGMVSKIIPTE
jgi:predicted metal-dependent hydrolase